MEREKVIELAKIAGIIFNEGNPAGSHMVDKMVEFSRLVEQETLERAAKKCDEVAESWIDESNKDTARPLIEECAFEIRNLKETHE